MVDSMRYGSHSIHGVLDWYGLADRFLGDCSTTTRYLLLGVLSRLTRFSVLVGLDNVTRVSCLSDYATLGSLCPFGLCVCFDSLFPFG